MVSTHLCRICGCSTGSDYAVIERMHGMGETFPYFQCAQCGARQLVHIPEDLSRYYPVTYESHRRGASGRLRRRIRLLRNTGHLRRHSIGALLAWIVPDPSLAAIGRLRPRLEAQDRVLDVGCGAGSVLHRLEEVGFLDLTGVDPLIPDDLTSQGGRVRIWKAELDDLPRGSIGWDLVLVNHVIEHVEDSIGLLKRIAKLLRDRGKCLVRTPIADSWAATYYGPHWVQHDAPRHILIHTERSLAMAASLAGLTIVDSWYDSTEFQFWGSEMYRRDNALMTAWTRWRVMREMLSPRGLVDRVRAHSLNRRRLGDQGCFVLARQ